MQINTNPQGVIIQTSQTLRLVLRSEDVLYVDFLSIIQQSHVEYAKGSKNKLCLLQTQTQFFWMPWHTSRETGVHHRINSIKQRLCKQKHSSNFQLFISASAFSSCLLIHLLLSEQNGLLYYNTCINLFLIHWRVSAFITPTSQATASPCA